MDDSDAGALVKAALQNDDEAARALVQRLYPLVVRIVRSHRSRRTSEEDLCQMIFIKVFQKLSQEEQAVIENLASSSDELAPDQRFASRQLVEHLLAALKPVERLAIDLLYLQGRSVEEIRKITGWSAALVKVRAFRARQKMKQQLAKISEKEKQ
jgi:RNA polymerase sigma-70 factor, ECF subfamily